MTVPVRIKVIENYNKLFVKNVSAAHYSFTPHKTFNVV